MSKLNSAIKRFEIWADFYERLANKHGGLWLPEDEAEYQLLHRILEAAAKVDKNKAKLSQFFSAATFDGGLHFLIEALPDEPTPRPGKGKK